MGQVGRHELRDYEFAARVVQEFPELGPAYERLAAEATRECQPFSAYWFWAEVVMPRVVLPAFETQDPGRLAAYFGLMEPLADRVDAYTRQFVAVQVCEVLFSNDAWYEAASTYLGPNLEKSCAAFVESNQGLLFAPGES